MAPQAHSKATPPAQFEFVTEHDAQTQIRQHVAKLAWRRRREQKQLPHRVAVPEIASKAAHTRPIAPQLQSGRTARQHPKGGQVKELGSHVHSTDPHDVEQALKRLKQSSNGVYMDLRHTLILMSPSKEWKLSTIPTPIDRLISPYSAVNNVELDPFNSTIELSMADQKLLHHWVNEYAYKAFGRPTDPAFNPLGDAYVPPDLSHKASVHGVLAHSASHLAYLQGQRVSVEALRHKMAAIHLVNEALQDPSTAVSDENISAVHLMLTYERYWGTEEVWQFHRRGLNQMIKRRGGLSSFSDNWRLETRLNLVALMQTPRWRSQAFGSSVAFSPFDQPHPENPEGTEMPHSDFTNFFSDIHSVTPDIALQYPAIQRATNFLHSLAQATDHHRTTTEDHVKSQEIARLMCLFYIATIVKGANRSHFNLLWLDDSLARTEQVWNNSVEILRWLLLQGVGRGKGGLQDVERTERLKEIASLLNKSSYKRMEERLLSVLVDGPTEDPLLPCE